jgi:hypothetical protein
MKFDPKVLPLRELDRIERERSARRPAFDRGAFPGWGPKLG